MCACARNYSRGSSSGGQLYGGRARAGRGRGLVDDVQSSRRGPRTISQSQQMPKLPSQSTGDQNLSDVGNEEWETASESSDVLAHHHTQDSALGKLPDLSKQPRGDTKKHQTSDRSQRDNLSEPRSAGYLADARNGQRSSSSGNNGRMNQRGLTARDQAASARSSATPDATVAGRFVVCT